MEKSQELKKVGNEKSDPYPYQREYYEAYIDYLKHLTTLSTGSIILIATFLEKLFASPLWKLAAVISLVGFMISVLSSIIFYTFILLYRFPGGPRNKESQWMKAFAVFGIFFTWIGFLIGILSLAIFALRNLLK